MGIVSAHVAGKATKGHETAATKKAVKDVKSDDKHLLMAALKEERDEAELSDEEDEEEDQVEELEDADVDPSIIKEIKHRDEGMEAKAQKAEKKAEQYSEKEEKIAQHDQDTELKKAGVDATVLNEVMGNDKHSHAEKKPSLLLNEVDGGPLAHKKMAKLEGEQKGVERDLQTEEAEEKEVMAAKKLVTSGKKGHFELKLPEIAGIKF